MTSRRVPRPSLRQGLPAVAEEGFALEVAVEFIGELDAEVLEDVFLSVFGSNILLFHKLVVLLQRQFYGFVARRWVVV